MKIKTMVIMLLSLILFPLKSFAISFDYNVTGEFEINGGITSIAGKMTISDEFLYHDVVGSSSRYYGFNITQFSLYLSGASGQLNFSGNSGKLAYLPMIFDSQTGNWLYERQWDLRNSITGDSFSNSYDAGGIDHPSIGFYSSDMQLYDPTSVDHFGELAPYISLLVPDYFSGILPPQNYSRDKGGLFLTQAAPPVPEPATLLLFGTGLVGLACMRFRSKK